MILLEEHSAFLPKLWDLLSGYWTQGKPFLALHLLVIVFIFWTWRKKIQPEINALRDWRPQPESGQPGDTSIQTTPILDDFVLDSKRLGPGGSSVPMTDYSDRLDSIADSLVAQLHDQTNLFIIVGVAGTLFGIFEFAFNAQNASSSVQELGRYLTSSMSKAFPVGFMGLVLAFFSQLIVALPERRLREALSKATRKALGYRASIIQTQAQMVQQAAEDIKTAMAPVKGLEATLTDSLKPVVDTLADRLDQTLVLVRDQFTELEKATNSVHNAVNSVKEGVTSLQTAANSMEGLLQNAPEVLRNITSTQAHQQASLEEFETTLGEHLSQSREISTALRTAAEGLTALPQSLSQGMGLMFNRIGEESLAVWGNMSDELAVGIRADYEQLLNDVTAQAEGINQIVAEMSKELKEVTQVTDNAIRGFNELPNNVLTKLDEAFNNLSIQSAAAWKQSSVEFMQQLSADYTGLLENINAQASSVSQSVADVSKDLNNVASSASAHLEEIKLLPKGMMTNMEATFGILGEQSLNAWRQTSDRFGEDIFKVYVGYMGDLQAASKNLEGSLAKNREEFERGLASYDGLIKQSIRQIVTEAKTELEGSLQSAHLLLTTALPTMSQNIDAFTGKIGDLITRVETVQKEYDIWLDRTTAAQQKIREIHDEISKVRDGAAGGNGEIAPLLKSSLDELIGANKILEQIQGRIPSSGNEFNKDLRSSIALLENINKGIKTLVNKKGPIRSLFSSKSKNGD